MIKARPEHRAPISSECYGRLPLVSTGGEGKHLGEVSEIREGLCWRSQGETFPAKRRNGGPGAHLDTAPIMEVFGSSMPRSQKYESTRGP
jgi:hypothetical protein